MHLRLVPVPVDAGGLDVDAFARAAKRTGARVAYLMPTLQNPTGVTLTAGRRKALLQAAIRHDVILIEDDEYGVFSSTLPLAADAPDRCIYLTGVSKAVAPGLRVGLLRAPAALVPRLGAAVFASSVMAPPFGTGWSDAGSRTGSPSASSPGSAASSRRAPLARRFSGRAAAARPAADQPAIASRRRCSAAWSSWNRRGCAGCRQRRSGFAVGQAPPFVRICSARRRRRGVGPGAAVLRDVRASADAARGDGVIASQARASWKGTPAAGSRRDRGRSRGRSSRRRPDPRS
jgi:hypothetical protein